ncbi:hypothetical protein PHJA_000441400 [Phtheirospermum japonicum]|uniref:Uncharacterized protein n=1 Tax=Phtheirospermum japonicum TaxID=374723 RepID=A0A830BFE3_9LAMI|nr:hypothetical protein PHJA_000441400 [Phtheirospermum japonicum]
MKSRKRGGGRARKASKKGVKHHPEPEREPEPEPEPATTVITTSKIYTGTRHDGSKYKIVQLCCDDWDDYDPIKSHVLKRTAVFDENGGYKIVDKPVLSSV